MFYLLGGLWETILCSVLLAILLVCARTIWRDLAAFAMATGIVESVMVWGCKLAITSPPPMGMTNCQHATGLPIGATAMTIELMSLAGLLAIWALKWAASRGLKI